VFTGAPAADEGAVLGDAAGVAEGEVDGELAAGELQAPRARTASAITTFLAARVVSGKNTAASSY